MSAGDIEAKISRIDERAEHMVADFAKLLESIEQLNRAVFVGNGHQSLVTRVSLLEQQFEDFLEQCARCQALIVQRPKGDGARKVEVVERWKFWAAVAVAGISTLGGIVAAVVR